MASTNTDYGSVKVKCRNCGKDAPANSFVLDHVYRMMVCQQCVKDRQKREILHKQAKQELEEAKAKAEEAAKKPAGWDDEDDVIEKAYAEKQAKQAKHGEVVEIGGGKVKRSCYKCKYQFVYNPATNTPNRCPYCNASIFD